MNTHRLTILSCAFAVAAVGLVPRPSEACGGFFCSQASPVEQVGERILFVQIDDNTLEAHIQVSYTGPSESFSWVVPTPAFPEVSVGSDFVFSVLQGFTTPYLRSTSRTEGVCAEPEYDDPGYWGDDDADWNSPQDAGSSGDASADAADEPVTVHLVDQVGPFDFAILQATSAEEMRSWLIQNGYDIDEAMIPYLQPYVSGNSYFVAFKLTKDASTGDLQPVVLRFNDDAPMIPIQLTAVAAQPNMEILAWILAENYAMPSNYRVAELQPLRLSVETVATVASAAIDEAGGRAFVRERAESTVNYQNQFWTEGSIDLDYLRDITDPLMYWEELLSMAWMFRGDPLMIRFFLNCIPMPDELADSVAATDFYNALWEWDGYLDVENFDANACTEDLENRLIEPRRHLQEMFDDLPRISRFRTFLDPGEMTLDPGFCYDSDADDESGQWEVTYTTHCNDPERYSWDAPRSIAYGDTQIYFGPQPYGDYRQIEAALREVPALLQAYETDCAGNVQVVEVGNTDTAEQQSDNWWAQEWADYTPGDAPSDPCCRDNWDDPYDDYDGGDDWGNDATTADAGATQGPRPGIFGNGPGIQPDLTANGGTIREGGDESSLCSTTPRGSQSGLWLTLLMGLVSLRLISRRRLR